MSKRFFEKLSDDIVCLDTGLYRPKMAACYIIVQKGYAMIIDTGAHQAVPRIVDCLSYLNIPLENVLYIIPTHVHLDHAGAAGFLMQLCKNAKLYLHPRGAPHMIDPSKLQAGATAVYGVEKFKETYGELQAVDAAKVHSVDDKETLNFKGRVLLFRHTPGHARHHICIYDKQSRGFFTGDTFGLSYREFDSATGPLLIPTTTPVQFEPDAWYESINILLSYKPHKMYLTHYGEVGNVGLLAEILRLSIAEYVTVANTCREMDNRKAAIKKGLFSLALNKLAKTACTLSEQECHKLLDMDMELNAQGLEVWLNKVYA